MGILFQVICTLIICYQCMTLGVIYTWPSSTIRSFGSANTTLHRPMTEAELSLFGSLSSVGGLISTPVFGVTLDKLGRKTCVILASLTGAVGWSIVSISNRVEVILLATFVQGFSGSLFLVCTTYIVDICQESIRGTLASGTVIFYNLGMLVSYAVGGYLSYTLMVYVNLTMAVFGVLLLLFLKESPLFLIRKDLEQEAAESIAFYRSVYPDSKEVLNEIANIRRSLNPDLDESPEEENLNPDKKVKENLSRLQFIKKSKSTKRALVLALTLMTACIFQGLPAVQVYAEPLFADAVPTISPTICSLIFAAINIPAGVLAGYLTDVVGRRPLVLYGSIATGACCLLLGSQIQFIWCPHWFTAIAICLFSIVYMMGAGTVPYVIVGEVFLPEIKTTTAMIVSEWTWACNFVILFLFGPLVSLIGLGPVFYIFACVCFLTTVFSYFFQPETMGLSVDAIQLALTTKRL